MASTAHEVLTPSPFYRLSPASFDTELGLDYVILRALRFPGTHGLVQQSSNVLLPKPLSGAEDHDPILD